MIQRNRPKKLHNLSSSSNINWKKYRKKGYFHFDTPVKVDYLKNKIQNPNWVSSYAFYPFLHFQIIFKRYREIDKHKKLDFKIRDIFYAAHKDQFIYKYYGDILNNAYNQYALEHNIDDITTAYRNNKKINNIQAAYDVFNFLFSQEEAYVISIDFEKFFDNINHKYLKQNIKTVLSMEELPKDWYTVFKNTTKYAFIEKEEFDNTLKDLYGAKALKRRDSHVALTNSQFRELKRKSIKVNKKPYGIPQGSGMSAVCSNVHLIQFDKQINTWAQNYNALYRRYSDDLIIVIPKVTLTPNLNEIKKELMGIIASYSEAGISIQSEKTDIRIWRNKEIINEKGIIDKIDYLGFVTNGKAIYLREKSLFKYYSRAYRKAKASRRIGYATGRPAPRKSLYQIYTHLGFNYQNYGNFITYANKAHNTMNKLPIKSKIKKQIKRHWTRIHKRLEP